MTAPDAAASRTASDDEIASVEEQLRLLFVRARAVWKEAAAAVHPDLQPVGYKILSAIVRRGPMHAGAIAAELEIDKSVVSRQIRHLQALGLAEGAADPTDGRARIIRPTPQAIERVGQKASRMQRQTHAKLRTWPAEDVEQLARLLGRLANEVMVAEEPSPGSGDEG
ncbi:MarR family winged helix-turn-helix transcriptional regulator [Agromyces sp. H66]|uniref:MarR family winged helix-turn-helix transcriptional regulator n=1 Tax=Agromyces sp. H66 TaxID=2529859 RepID=UPI0010AADD91|nr:MarR family winged helix-turn-helix transcriptional regulator [Agromyces sp. H66]